MNFWIDFCVDSLLWTKYGLLYTRDERTVKTMDFTEPAPKKAKTGKSAGKVMATVFWDARAIIHYRSSVETNDQWRRSLIGSFQQHFKEKTSSFGEEKSALPSRQDNARVHTCPASMAKFNEFR